MPSLYYGDEIGMRYLPDLPNVEGAICSPLYNRAGCRTPMQWDDGPNAGFSAAPADSLYLPIEMRRVRDLQPYVGKEIEAKIIELDKNRNNVVLSRRAWLEQRLSVLRLLLLFHATRQG